MSQLSPLDLSTIRPDTALGLARPTPPRSLGWLLQLAHRAAAVALMLAAAVVVMLYLGQDFHLPLAATFGASNIGLCAALAAWALMGRRSPPLAGEAIGVAVFNGIILAMSLELMLISRLDLLRAAGSALFTPQ